MHADYRQYNKPRHHRATLKLIKYVGIAFMILAAGGLYFNQRNSGPTTAKSIDEFLVRVQKHGGSLSRCEKGSCWDLKTHTFMGMGEDGMYITYPTGTVSDDELARQSEVFKRLLAAEKAKSN